MVYDWKNKMVLITGAANGIGAEVVRALMNEAVKHIAILDVDEAQGLALETELNTKHGKPIVRFIKCDVSAEDQLSAAFKTVVDQYEYIDVVINNAGVFLESSDHYRKEIEINYTGLVSSSLKALELMRQDEGGRGGTIINVASTAALLQIPFCPVYSGTKSAVLQFSLCIGMDPYYLKTGVRVITICYGATATSIAKNQDGRCFDKEMNNHYDELIANYESQSPTEAASGLVDAFKHGASASTWLINAGKPAEDISDAVKKAYAILAELT